VEADEGGGGGNPLTLLQLHIGSCTKVTEQQSNGTDVCCCSGRSPAGGEAAYHISLYQRMTLFTMSSANSQGQRTAQTLTVCARFRVSCGYFHIRISDPKFDIRISGYRLSTLILTYFVVLLRYPKPTPKPRFFAKTVCRRNLGFSAIIEGFWAHLHAKII